jgi:hypothetical protein
VRQTGIGKAKFYEGTLPADFIRPDPANPHTKSGDRRSTTSQPPFWDGTGTDHNIAVFGKPPPPSIIRMLGGKVDDPAKP